MGYWKVEVYPRQKLAGYHTEEEERSICAEIQEQIRRHVDSVASTYIVAEDE